MRLLRIVALALLTLGLYGCAFKFAPYQTASTQFAEPNRVLIEIANHDAVLRTDPFMGGPRPHGGGTRPSVAEYVKEALSREFAAAGFQVVQVVVPKNEAPAPRQSQAVHDARVIQFVGRDPISRFHQR